MKCNQILKNEGKAYPRICAVCVYGPCQYRYGIKNFVLEVRDEELENTPLFMLFDAYLRYEGIPYKLSINSQAKSEVTLIISSGNMIPLIFTSFNEFVQWNINHGL